jgi:hypothetical protein
LNHDNYSQNEGLSRTSHEKTNPLHDATGIFQEAVEAARYGIQRSLAGNEKVGEAVRPKLTIDLSHQSIERVSEEVVEIIKVDVERYNSILNVLRLS